MFQYTTIDLISVFLFILRDSKLYCLLQGYIQGIAVRKEREKSEFDRMKNYALRLQSFNQFQNVDISAFKNCAKINVSRLQTSKN